jgi:hypothetical protein
MESAPVSRPTRAGENEDERGGRDEEDKQRRRSASISATVDEVDKG